MDRRRTAEQRSLRGPAGVDAATAQALWASRYAEITSAGIRPRALTRLPWARAPPRAASDCPRRGGVVAAPDVDRFRGAPGRRWDDGASFTDTVRDLEAADFTASALLAEVLFAVDLRVPFADALRTGASLRVVPEADSLSDPCAMWSPVLAPTASPTVDDCSVLLA